ncbi:MAG TPA: alpha/beta hydrolase domain-containing protein, partial [Methylomirabilota bacterium]|nr:alpha/beta hydrolase domain-containing protein [Methylomirabilota bacterium]
MPRIVLGVLALLLTASLAEAGVTRLEITRREPFVAGQTFGSVGAYEKLVGRFHGELDPAHPLNRVIVDLDLAPRNTRGRVEYSADFYLLKPVELGRGNGALLYDVNNRGNKRVLLEHNSGRRADDPSTAEDAGNGFLMRHGFVVLWSGWIPGAAAKAHDLRVQVPAARPAGGRLSQLVWDDFQFNNATVTQAKLTFPVAERAGATLTVRERTGQAPTTLAAGTWEFTDDSTIRLLPAGTAFRIGSLYQLVYKAADPPVAGIGFAATRDLVAFLKHERADAVGAANPLVAGGAPAVRRALAHGTSQSGRYLRDFVYQGFNEDEAGRIVFEGMNPHVATARMFLNQRFAQPDRGASALYPDQSFPYAYETQTDTVTGRRDGILARCAARGNCPKILHTVSSNEYWNAGHSLVTTDTLGRADGTPPADVRIYHVAGTQHTGGRGGTMPKDVCALPFNPTDLHPVLRAVTLALDAWVKDGTPPPPSRYPRLDDRTLVAMENVGFPRLPGVETPVGPIVRRRIDYGADWSRGIVGRTPPEPLSPPYVSLVPRVDGDGNEIGGLRLPDVSVPYATLTGWAVRAASVGNVGAICGLDGFILPFARTTAE